MKNIIFFTVAVLFAFCTSASAQFTNTTAHSGSNGNDRGYTTLYFQYNPSAVEFFEALNYDFKGVSIGINRGISVSPEFPLFVELGGALQYSFGDKFDYKMNFLSTKFPINLTYNWEISDNFTLIPYTGLTFRINVWGRGKYTDEDYYADDYYYYYNDYEDYVETGSHNLFGDEGGCKRFQIGWQTGANFKFNKFYLGASYGTDFNKFTITGQKIQTTSITVGIVL